jgi:hypothetical protein
VSDEREGVPVSVAWILLAALGAAILLTNLMRSPDSSTESGFPATANGLPVVTVPDAIEVQQLGADTDVAVSGWFQQPSAIECPFPQQPVVPLLNGDCAIDFTWLMRDPESLVHVRANGVEGGPPESPSVHPVFDGPAAGWARPLPREGDSTPTPVVFIGHFNDSRSEGCRPDNQPLCLSRFVVTVVAWADGADTP